MDNVAPAERPISGRRIPMTLKASYVDGKYQQVEVWPIRYAAIRDQDIRYTEALRAIIAATDDRTLKDLLALGAVQVGWITRIFSTIALHAIAARANRQHFDDGENIVDYLLRVEEEVPKLALGRPYKPTVKASMRFRALARSFTFTDSVLKGVLSTLNPDAIAISHNPLMIAYARQSNSRIRFRHADSILHAARRQSSTAADSDRVDRALQNFVEAMRPILNVPDDMFELLRKAISANARPVLEQADRDMMALNQLPSLPKTLWCGSTGSYPVRAVALAVKRRNGRVVGFDHGGTANFVDDKAFLELFEYGIKDDHIVPTTQAAEIQSALYDPAKSMFGHAVHFSAGSGDPTFINASKTPKRQTKPKPVILFVITVYGGHWFRLPPILPDHLAVSVQKQVLGHLKTLDATVLVRPHPETRLYGLPHPLAEEAAFDESPFRSALNSADVVVFDYPQTTTLWETACSDRPIILVDSGIGKINHLAEPLVDARINRIPVDWDENNMPRVPGGTLIAAIEQGLHHAANPQDFKALLAA